MQYADKIRLTFKIIKNRKNTIFLRIFKFVKTRDFPQFLKFVIFSFSIYGPPIVVLDIFLIFRPL